MPLKPCVAPLRGEALQRSVERLALCQRVFECTQKGMAYAELARHLQIRGPFNDQRVMGRRYTKAPSHLRRFMEAWPLPSRPGVALLERLLGEERLYDLSAPNFLAEVHQAVRVHHDLSRGASVLFGEEEYLEWRPYWLNQEGMHGAGRIGCILAWIDETEAALSIDLCPSWLPRLMKS